MNKLRAASILVIVLLLVSLVGIHPGQAYSIQNSYKKVSRDLEKIRGLKFKKTVPYSTKSKDYLRQFLAKTLDKELPPQKLKAMDTSLKLFGFVPQNFNTKKFLLNLYSEQIAGMYDPQTKQMMLMEGGGGVDENSPEALQMKQYGMDVNDIFLIHEMQHAIQDQYYNLSALISKVEKLKNDDRITAFQALMEGDATMVMMQYMIFQISQQFGGSDMSEFFDMSSMREMMSDAPMGASQQQFANAPLFFKRQMLFPYLDGMVFVDRLKKKGGWTLVNNAYANPPLSTEQIFHIDRYLSREYPIKITFGLSKNLNNFTMLDENVIGELGLRILFEHFLGAGSNFKGIASGWGGDRYRVYSAGNENFLVWYTTWDTENDAKEFLNSYLKLLQKKYRSLKWVRKAPQVAYLGEVNGKHVYTGISGKDVICLEKVPQNLTNPILENIWKVKKVYEQ